MFKMRKKFKKGNKNEVEDKPLVKIYLHNQNFKG